MKTLYIECNMGAAGDMLTAALLELTPDPHDFLRRMNEAGLPGVRMVRSDKTSCGVQGTHISVIINDEEETSDDIHAHDHAHHHHDHHDHDHANHHHDHHDHDHHDHAHHVHSHAGLGDVQSIVAGLKLPEEVKADILGVYALIAAAESHAHGCPVEQVHFHEVGMMDAIADISAVCLLMHELAPDHVVVSPLCTGFGQVRCMHGIVPVPAPATAYLLKDIPSYSGNIRGELLTPTGAALLKYFADEFGGMPCMRIESVGMGMGMKEFEAANCVRAMIGRTGSVDGRDEVLEISCNLDDMTGEAIAFAAQTLMDAGALDAYLVPIQMKKGRPAVMLCCICRLQDEKLMAGLILRHTTTLGVRMQRMQRRTLERSYERVQTSYGEIGVKIARGEDFTRSKAEFEDAAAAARRHGVSVMEVMRAAEKAGE